jgi:hypothetical protein
MTVIEIPIKYAGAGARFIAPAAATITEGAINRAPTVRGM